MIKPLLNIFTGGQNMKIMIVFLLLYILATGCNISMDLLSGISINESMENMMSPFVVMSFPEYASIVIFISVIIIKTLMPNLVKKIKSAAPKKK
jgi:hypothetical protein